MIGPVDKDDPISANSLNRLSQEVAARTVMGIGVSQHSAGTLLARKLTGLDPAPRRGANSHPLKVIDASTGEPSPAAKVRVRFGQVNSITPSIGGIALDADPSDPPVLTVASGLVYLALVLSEAGAITSASIHNDEELPATDDTHAYITLATVTVAANKVTAINQAVTASLQWLRCNGNDLFGAV
jgi:hypothetical protein